MDVFRVDLRRVEAAIWEKERELKEPMGLLGWPFGADLKGNQRNFSGPYSWVQIDGTILQCHPVYTPKCRKLCSFLSHGLGFV